jgi:hypothetical protein
VTGERAGPRRYATLQKLAQRMACEAIGAARFRSFAKLDLWHEGNRESFSR